ncbi:hypothetical protein [Candidatus Competibacter denitrificans]|uniref:hypothetical protein n=1 Tax=Candidatus Competibacter denitrificans TaxID=1400862 RepID=UPI001112AA50|nr:hypothetical protein [Candidatus Competibacter denitrificans]
MQAKATKPCRVRGAHPTPMLDGIGERISCWNAKQRVGQALDRFDHPPVNPRHRMWGTTTIPSFLGHNAVSLMQGQKNERFSGTDPYCARQTPWVLF